MPTRYGRRPNRYIVFTIARGCHDKNFTASIFACHTERNHLYGRTGWYRTRRVKSGSQPGKQTNLKSGLIERRNENTNDHQHTARAKPCVSKRRKTTGLLVRYEVSRVAAVTTTVSPQAPGFFTFMGITEAEEREDFLASVAVC
jgi:hypothetical protein